MHSPRALLPALVLTALLVGCPAEEKRCPASQTLCFGNCVDSQTDAGACGPACAPCPMGGSCVAGTCECPLGQTQCGRACVDTRTNADHCGGCSHRCGLGTCDEETCTCDAAPVTACPGLWPQCVNTTNDATNCGSCGYACPLDHDVCVSSVCTCPTSLPDACPTTLPTACVNRQTDAQNCGDCGKVCATGATCVAGGCECPGSTVVCGTAPGSCTDTSSDPLHCGGCATVCPTGATCESSGCVCPSGQLQICGTTTKTCCPGSGCCGDSCQTAHPNGLGQTFYDCNPVGTHTKASATAAADAWRPGATIDMVVQGCAGCLGRRTSDSCAVWCYSGSFEGQVGLNTIDIGCWCPPQFVVDTWN